VVWTVTSGGQILNGLFEASTAYTATVTLTAASGYTFTGVGPNAFDHAGKSAISNGAGSGTVVITFPATAAITVTPINNVDLTNVLPAPIAGGTPFMDFNTGSYRVSAAWTTSMGVPVTMFESGTVYTAAVTLYPEAGYSFPVSLPVIHGTISIANFTGDPRQGTVTFPPTGILSFYSGPFSGSSVTGTGDMDSAIDMIKVAKTVGHNSLYLQLAARIDETVDLDTADRDITGGLELNTTNSPASVVIDGGKRTIQLTGTGSGSLITVQTGVTLSLRNITLNGNPLVNQDPLIEVESGGRLILETGAVMTYNVATGGTVSYGSVDGDPAKVWEIHTFTASGMLTFFTNAAVSADYLIVAGGGGSGGDQNNNSSEDFAGGGGAGGLMYKTGETLSPSGAMQIIVGAGGAGGQKQTQGADGGKSAIGAVEVPGGGGGGCSTANMNGRPGGSGGGGGAGVAVDKGTGGGRSSIDTDILGNKGGDGGQNPGGGGGAEGLGTTGAAGTTNKSASPGGLPWIAANNNASWVSAVTSGTTEFSRGGNGGGTNAPRGGRAGINYGDGGSAGNNQQQQGGAGHNGVVVIRFQRFAVVGP
jgi:hypothetical protein